MGAESNEELASGLAEDFSQLSEAQARFIVRLGEFERRQAFRDDGATSLESFGSPSVSTWRRRATAAYARGPGYEVGTAPPCTRRARALTCPLTR